MADNRENLAPVASHSSKERAVATYFLKFCVDGLKNINFINDQKVYLLK